MGRPRIPESQLSPESVAHNKGVYERRKLEPRTYGRLRGPSAWLTPEQKIIWRSLVKHSPAILGESDRTLLEVVSVLKSKLVVGNLKPTGVTLLISTLNKLGFIPHSRAAAPGRGKAKVTIEDDWESL